MVALMSTGAGHLFSSRGTGARSGDGGENPPGLDIAREREEVLISEILDDTPEMLDLVYNDLIRNRRIKTGREGKTAEQVFRAFALKQYRCLT